MRLTTTLLLAVLIPVPALAATKNASVEWIDEDFARGLALAKKTNRPMMVDVYATWCGPCHEMDREVFSRPDVGDEAAHFVSVRIDAEKAQGPDLVEKYHVVGYPTVLFLDPDGVEIDRVFGSLPAQEFITTMRDYREGRGTLAQLTEKALKNPFDLELALEVGSRHAVRGNAIEAKRHFARIFATRRRLKLARAAAVASAKDVTRFDAGQDFHAIRKTAKEDHAAALQRVDGLAAQSYLVLGKYLYLRGEKDYPTALRIFAQLRRKFPKSAQAKGVPYQVAVAHHKMGNSRKAKAELTRYLDQNGRGAGPANTIAWFCFRQGVFMDWGQQVAETALEREPEAAALWDTLAELLNARGDVAGAVDAIRKARALEPGEPYYEGQLTRFEAGMEKG